MADLLNLGAQSALVAQKQLNTTGHNISNVNTEGYSRQSVIQGTNNPTTYGGETYGMGVHVENVRRSWDQFAVNELNLSETNFSNKKESEENINMLTSMLSSAGSKKVPENINEWFDSIKSLADTPNDIGARKVVLEKTKLISNTLNNFHETIRQQSDVVNKKLEMGVKRVNQIATEIRDIHRQMMRSPGPHNDLMDKHEKLVSELSQYTKVTVTPRANSEGFNIHIGNGNTLVSGVEASELKMIDGDPDVKQQRLAMVEGKGIKALTSDGIDGKLAALFDMRDKQIPHLMDELGRLSATLSKKVNDLQSQGLDLKGRVGQNIFTDINSEAVAKSRVVAKNNSKADLAVFVDDLSQLKSGEYALRYDGSEYTVTKPNGERESLFAVPDKTGGSALFLDGMKIQIRHPPSSGERILLRPTRQAAEQIQMMTDDPERIAAQSYEASSSFAKGTANFNIVKAGQLQEFGVVISPDGDKFAVVDKEGKLLVEPQLYPPTGAVTVLGTTFELGAGAMANDKFTANLTPAEGDNGNLRKLQNIQTEKGLDNHESTLIDIYHNLNTEVGLKISTASRLTDIARLENESAKERIASIAGVNLDEEAANMMKFQQAYMASSRVMQVANDTFNTILQLR